MIPVLIAIYLTGALFGMILFAFLSLLVHHDHSFGDVCIILFAAAIWPLCFLGMGIGLCVEIWRHGTSEK